jgi:DNA-binding GntR family transcriptional regulator
MEKKCQVDIAYDYLKNAIINKAFFPGNRLIEEDIVRETGVSRTSVRAALNQLRYEGIVDGTPNRGMMVTRFHPNDIKSVFQIRETLEIGALSLAIDRITPATIARMHQYNDILLKITKNFSISEFVKYNRAFHWEIPLASGNRYYQKYLDEVYNTIAVCLLFYNSSMDDQRSVQLHNDLIRAIEEKDFAAGKRAIIADNYVAVEDSGFTG